MKSKIYQCWLIKPCLIGGFVLSFWGCSGLEAPRPVPDEKVANVVQDNGNVPDIEIFYPDNFIGVEQQRAKALESAEIMARAGRISPGSKVLEVGTGSGYEAAYFSSLGAKVYSVEILQESADLAKQRLMQLGFDKVEILVGDGWQGWKGKAPFDAIVVRASSTHVPQELLSQLANRGRLIVPIEYESKRNTSLLVIERSGSDFISHVRDATVSSRLTGEVRNIPQTIKSPSDYSLIQKLLEGGSIDASK